MSNLENNIKDCIAKELEKGIVEKVITEKLESCIGSALSDMFSWRGDVSKVIEDKVKSVMIPYIENYDYSQYIVKLDSVLTDVLKNSTLENKKILENFKSIVGNEVPEEIKITDIFTKWTEYCKNSIDNGKLDFDCDGAYMTTCFVTDEISSSWSSYETYMVRFECEEDEDLKYEFQIDRWKDRKDKFSLRYKGEGTIRSLRVLNDFEVFLMNISQGYENVILDCYGDSEETIVEYEE